MNKEAFHQGFIEACQAAGFTPRQTARLHSAMPAMRRHLRKQAFSVALSLPTVGSQLFIPKVVSPEEKAHAAYYRKMIQPHIAEADSAFKAIPGTWAGEVWDKERSPGYDKATADRDPRTSGKFSNLLTQYFHDRGWATYKPDLLGLTNQDSRNRAYDARNIGRLKADMEQAAIPESTRDAYAKAKTWGAFTPKSAPPKKQPLTV